MQRSYSRSELESFKDGLSITAVATALGLDVVRGRTRCFHPENHSHRDRTPSLSLNEERGSYKCWVCHDLHGDAIGLVQHLREIDFLTAVDWLEQSFGKISAENAGVIPQRKVQKCFSGASKKENSARKVDLLLREKIVLEFLRLLVPVEGRVGSYLGGRSIRLATWKKQKLRMVRDYSQVSRALADKFSATELKNSGFFNDAGHLRFYKHPLILPYLDFRGVPVFFQARAIEKNVTPKELNLRGPIPIPYNARLLDFQPGVVYLCEGVIDTLTLLDKGSPAVGVPGASSFKEEWTAMFREKQVYLAFDADRAGRSGGKKVRAMLESAGVGVHQVDVPEGKDINDWFLGEQR